jgi:hypothetical protein
MSHLFPPRRFDPHPHPPQPPRPPQGPRGRTDGWRDAPHPVVTGGATCPADGPRGDRVERSTGTRVEDSLWGSARRIEPRGWTPR